MTEDDVELHQILNGEAYEYEKTNVDIKDYYDFEVENIIYYLLLCSELRLR